MGEVYLARDKKLDRKVAIKVLNEQFSQHESNLNRFISEAKAASALNHPNILVIHEIGEACRVEVKAAIQVGCSESGLTKAMCLPINAIFS